MNAFLVELENKPGTFATMAEAIAKKGINITGVGGSGGRAVVMTSDDAGTRVALKEANCSFKEMESTETQLTNEPGSLAKATRRLADAGVNIEGILPLGMTGNQITVSFVTNNPTKAREVLATTAAAR